MAILAAIALLAESAVVEEFMKLLHPKQWFDLVLPSLQNSEFNQMPLKVVEEDISESGEACQCSN